MTAKTLLRAVRAPSLTAGAMPVVLANASVFHRERSLDAIVFVVTLAGMVLVQSGVNLLNDYFDDRSGLDADPDFADSPFPLGSRVLQDGTLSHAGLLRLAAACFGIAAVAGLWLDARRPDHVVAGIAVVGALLGYFYTAPPLKLAYRGIGEPVTFLLFGPLAGAGATWAQVGEVDASAWLLAAFVGWLAMTILFLHHFPQHEADARYRKMTPVVRLGPERAGRLVPVLLGVPYLAIAAGVATGRLPWPVLAFWLTVPWATRVSRTALRSPADARRMTGAVGGTLAIHFVGSLAVAAGLVLA